MHRVAFTPVERDLFPHLDTSVRVSFRPAAGIVQLTGHWMDFTNMITRHYDPAYVRTSPKLVACA
jgi:hypothetical protein